MRKNLLLGLSVFVFAGCSAVIAPKDILSDRLTEERVYTAVKNYPELIKINKEKLAKKDNEKNRLALANNYYEIGDFNSALYYIDPLLKKDKSAGAWLLNAKIYDSLNKTDDALKSANACLKLEPKNAQCFNLLGISQTKKSELKQANESLLKAKALFLDDEVVNNNLAVNEMKLGNYKAAIAYLEPLYDRGIRKPRIINNLVLAYAKNGDKDKALKVIEKENLSAFPKLFLEKVSKINTINKTKKK